MNTKKEQHEEKQLHHQHLIPFHVMEFNDVLTNSFCGSLHPELNQLLALPVVLKRHDENEMQKIDIPSTSRYVRYVLRKRFTLQSYSGMGLRPSILL